MPNRAIVKYEVIADFPASILNVGDVVEVYETTGMAYLVEIYDQSEKYDVRDYPHLFRRTESETETAYGNKKYNEGLQDGLTKASESLAEKYKSNDRITAEQAVDVIMRLRNV